MGRTMTLDEVRERSITELLQEAAHTKQELVLELLPQFSVSIPEGWKDAIYGEDDSGRDAAAFSLSAPTAG